MKYSLPDSSSETTLEFTVYVRSYDYGAYGKLSAKLYGNIGTGVEKLDEDIGTVPRDENGNHIADGWKSDFYNKSLLKDGYVYKDKAKEIVDVEKTKNTNGIHNYQGSADDETGPDNNTRNGDGYTVFEEYRGFLTRFYKGYGGVPIVHTYLDPHTKDVFYVAHSELRVMGIDDIGGFPSISFIGMLPDCINEPFEEVWDEFHKDFKRDDASEVDVSESVGWVNTNSDGLPGVNNAYAVRIRNSGIYPGYIKGESERKYGVANTYKPNKLSSINIYVDIITHYVEQAGLDKMDFINYTIRHEAGHTINLEHCPVACVNATAGQGCLMRPSDFMEYVLNGKIIQEDTIGAAVHSTHNVDYDLAGDVQSPQTPATYERPKKKADANGFSGTLLAASDSKVSAGDTHISTLTMNAAYRSVYWYVKSPSDTSASGTNVQIDQGDLSQTVASLSYTFPSGVSGVYTISATAFPYSGSAYDASYTVPVNPSVPSSPVPTIPGVPTDVTTTASNGTVTLSWTAPEDDGGGIDKYQYRVDKNNDGTWGDWIDVPSDGTSLPLSVSVSVENGVDYAFQVLSNNIAGSNMHSITTSALPVDPSVSPPTVVGMLSATPSDGQVRLSWDEPGTGTPVIAYEYTYDESNDGSWSSWKRTKSTGTSHDVTGLTNDTIYAFKVRARNTGHWHRNVKEVTATPFAYTVPGKIRDLTASLTLDNKVRLDWKAPLDDGGTTITRYDYCKDTYNDGTWSIWYSTGDSSTAEIFSWVTPGVTYAFMICAVNDAGSGTASDPVVIRVPTVPSQPLTITASITSNKKVLLDWSAPADDGGSPITSYDYYTYADDGYGEVWLSTGDTLTEKSWHGAGFSAGLTYTFKVRAVNAIGIGTETESVTLTIPANTTPSAPLLLTASEGNASVYLSWNEPADDGYVVVRGESLKYQYRYRQSGGTWNSWNSEQWDQYATQSNLTNGMTYEFEVHAVNDVGIGTAASVSATPTGTAAPGVPQYFDTDGDNGSVDLWWDPPEYDGGSSITDYEYRYKESSSSNWNGWTSAGNADEEYPEFSVTGLTNVTSYDFQVRARNAVGPGDHTATLTETPTAQRPDEPTGVSASAGTAAGTIDLTWTAPDDGGSAITNYKVIHGIFQNNRWTWTKTAISTGSTNTSYTVTGLQSGGLYRFRVRAVNSVGESANSKVAQTRAP